MTVNPSSRATAPVSSRLQSSTTMISSTVPRGMSSTVCRNVKAALYAGMTAIVRPDRANPAVMQDLHEFEWAASKRFLCARFTLTRRIRQKGTARQLKREVRIAKPAHPAIHVCVGLSAFRPVQLGSHALHLRGMESASTVRYRRSIANAFVRRTCYKSSSRVPHIRARD